MDKIVIDTSVVVKWFVEEKNSSIALKLLEDYQKEKLLIYIPEIIILELSNALYFGARFEPSIVEKAIEYFYALKVIHVFLTKSLIDQAIKIMGRFKIAIYDSLFVALAKEEKCSLVTCDTKHHRKEMYPKIKYL